MRRCPACRTEMNVITAASLELDACPGCGGFWCDHGELEALAGAEAVAKAVASAHGGKGRCKGCQGELPDDLRECVTCGHLIPLCPACGAGPLRVGNVRGINLDVCPRCSGIFLDSGELQLVSKDLSKAALVQAAAHAPRAGAHKPRKPLVCAGCQKSLQRAHAFVAGDEYYCGTCAPRTAAPLAAKLTPKGSSFYSPRCDEDGRAYRGDLYGSEDGLSYMLAKAFSFIFSSK